MSNGMPLGGCSAILHLVASYPKVAACAAILGVGGTQLSSLQLEECDEKIAQCRSGAPSVPVMPLPMNPIVTAIETAKPIVVEEVLPEALVIDLCKGAPVLTDADIFTVSGKPFLWKHGGADPVRGHAAEPFLQKLEYTSAEREYFMHKVATGQYARVHLQNGDSVGRSTSGSGKVMNNTIVQFSPVVNTGANYKNDARMNVYTYSQNVVYNGNCVERTVTLYEPLVCQNWSRPSDTVRLLHPVADRREDEIFE